MDEVEDDDDGVGEGGEHGWEAGGVLLWFVRGCRQVEGECGDMVVEEKVVV